MGGVMCNVGVEAGVWVENGRQTGKWAVFIILLLAHICPTYAQYTESGAWVGVENNTVVNVKAQMGYNAFLPCSVRMVGDKQISWIRRRDWHVLTSGVLTYTKDERFSVTHRDGAEDWTLTIKYLQARDNGTYECQISTGTGIVSQFVNLNVIVPEAFILGNSEYHVEIGSPINLYCIIEQSPTPPHVVYWRHRDRLLNYDTQRGGVNVNIEHGAKTASRLIISNAVPSDNGNYTCEAPNTQPATVHVFITHAGQITAAIQKRTSGSTGLLKGTQWVTSFLPLLITLWTSSITTTTTTIFTTISTPSPLKPIASWR